MHGPCPIHCYDSCLFIDIEVIISFLHALSCSRMLVAAVDPDTKVVPHLCPLGSAPGRGVIPTLARAEWSLARSSGEVRAGCWAAMDVLR